MNIAKISRQVVDKLLAHNAYIENMNEKDLYVKIKKHLSTTFKQALIEKSKLLELKEQKGKTVTEKDYAEIYMEIEMIVTEQSNVLAACSKKDLEYFV